LVLGDWERFAEMRDGGRWPENSERECMTDRGGGSGGLQGKASGEEARAAVRDTERECRQEGREEEKKKEKKIKYGGVVFVFEFLCLFIISVILMSVQEVHFRKF
jgi:hypothetical protein